MARNSNPNGTGKSRASAGSASRERSGVSESSGGRSSRGGQVRSASSKSNPELASSPRRGFQAGQRRGRAAVETVRSAGARAVESVKQHPIPAVMIGAGLAWWLLENNRTVRSAEERLLERGRETVSGLGEVLSSAGETLRDGLTEAGSVVGRSVTTAAEAIAEGTSTVGQYASTGASAVGEGVTAGYEYATETLADVWERHPLAAGATLLGLGVAAGMMLPSTVRESRIIGETTGEVARQLREKGNELLERGREIASSAARMVPGISGSESDEAPVVRKVKRAARGGGGGRRASAS